VLVKRFSVHPIIPSSVWFLLLVEGISVQELFGIPFEIQIDPGWMLTRAEILGRL